MDAAFSRCGAGFGFVIRDHMGKLILSGAGPLLNSLSPLHAELMGASKIFLMAQTSHLQLSIIEIDCKVVVQNLYIQWRG